MDSDTSTTIDRHIGKFTTHSELLASARWHHDW